MNDQPMDTGPATDMTPPDGVAPNPDAGPGDGAEAGAPVNVPDTPDGYSLTRPDLPQGLAYDEALETSIREQAHALGLTTLQLQGLIDSFAAYQSASHMGEARAGEEVGLKAQETLETSLREEWGRDFETRLDEARRASQALAGDDETLAALEGAMGDIRVVKLFQRIGAMMAEDSLAGLGNGGAGFSPAAARAEAERLETRIAGLLDRPDAGSRRERLALEDQRRKLLARAYSA